MSDKFRTLNRKTFDDLIEKHEQPVLVDFYADWCQPCRAIEPTLDNLFDNFQDKISIVQVDVDAEPELADRFHVRSIPTLKLIRGGEVVETVIGVKPKQVLEAMIERNLA